MPPVDLTWPCLMIVWHRPALHRAAWLISKGIWRTYFSGCSRESLVRMWTGPPHATAPLAVVADHIKGGSLHITGVQCGIGLRGPCPRRHGHRAPEARGPRHAHSLRHLPPLLQAQPRLHPHRVPALQGPPPGPQGPGAPAAGRRPAPLLRAPGEPPHPQHPPPQGTLCCTDTSLSVPAEGAGEECHVASDQSD